MCEVTKETTAETAPQKGLCVRGKRKEYPNSEKRLLSSSCMSVRQYNSDSHYKNFSKISIGTETLVKIAQYRALYIKILVRLYYCHQY